MNKVDLDKFLAFNKPLEIRNDLPQEDDNSLLSYFYNLKEVFFIGAENDEEGLVIVTEDIEVGRAFKGAKIDIEATIYTKGPVSREILQGFRDVKGVFASRLKNAREIQIRFRSDRKSDLMDYLQKAGVDIFKIKILSVADIKMRMLGAGNSRLLTKKERRGLIDKL